tara:strand:- start:416 stop:571 length:156 start_codon:yes stop_codon:yes gene_type:complete
MGLDRSSKTFGLGKCGAFGDQSAEKPWFGDIMGVIKWDAWEKYRGVPETLC